MERRSWKSRLRTDSVILAGGIALSFGAVSRVHADICTDAQAIVAYDSSGGQTPDETADWSLTCTGQDGDGTLDSIVDGVLIVDDNSTTTKAKYCAEGMFEDTCDPRQDAVYEFACRVISVDLNANAWDHINSSAEFAFACGMSTGSNSRFDHDFRVAVTRNEGVGFWIVDGNGNASWLTIQGDQQRVPITLNGSGEWAKSHLFRIEKDDTDVKLFLDNEATASITILLEDLPNNFLANVARLASTSQDGKSKFEMTHFRYRIATTTFNTPDLGTCVGDIDADDDVDGADLLLLLAAWGPCTDCDEDLDDNDVVGASDLLILLGNWGVCP